MPVRWLVRRQKIHVTKHEHTFEDKETDGAGWGFPADEKGNILLSDLQMPALKNLRYCLDNPDKVTDKGHTTNEWDYWEDGLVECGVCGELFVPQPTGDLHEFQCPNVENCGQWYDSTGGMIKGYTYPFEGENEYGERYYEED